METKVRVSQDEWEDLVRHPDCKLLQDYIAVMRRRGEWRSGHVVVRQSAFVITSGVWVWQSFAKIIKIGERCSNVKESRLGQVRSL